ncbi:MAG: adenylosuccinate lyase [Clostridiales bacterium]|nr:adenylosuccinate lyase [Clostridiales bacterium]
MSTNYVDPLTTRYATKPMLEQFAEKTRMILWRKLWLALAESEKELGLNITDEQISQMKEHIEDINFEVAKERERIVRHDVMAYVYAYGQQCPKAMPIIHLGATSCYVTDNSDTIIYHDALVLVKNKLVNVMDKLAKFALKYADMPTLGFTHLQPAQLVTVGKRAALWLQELQMDYENLEYVIANTRLRGVKGTTGTQASFLQLFDGDHEKVKKLNELVVKKMGFDKSFAVSGQTYTRKYDYNILSVLSQIAQSAYKFANDIRILQNMKEIEEPFEKNQIGSSAMAYKRNPMRSERICSLARYVMTLPANAANTAATQWFERTLDDSANRRLVMAQAFLSIDAILEIYMNVADGLVVYENTINKHIMAELPFMSTEVILMECVKAGGDRQELHEKIRVHSMEASKMVKQFGKDNDLIERIKKDDAFSAINDKIDSILDPRNFIGRAKEQTIEFVNEVIKPILDKNKDCLGQQGQVNV